jgi:uncharacterized protein (TIGR00251 family)
LVKPNKKQDKAYFQEGSLFNTDMQTIIVETKQPPIEGKANKEVIRILGEFLGVRKYQITIKSGSKSKFKTITIS